MIVCDIETFSTERVWENVHRLSVMFLLVDMEDNILEDREGHEGWYADSETRTHNICLEGREFTINLYPHLMESVEHSIRNTKCIRVVVLVVPLFIPVSVPFCTIFLPFN